MASHTCIDGDEPAGKLQNKPPPVFLPLSVFGDSQFVLTLRLLTSLEARLALPERLSRLRPSIVYQMSIHFSFQQNEVQEERQRVVFDVWICKFQAFTALFKSQIVRRFVNCVEVGYGVCASDTDGHARSGKQQGCDEVWIT